MSGQKSEEDKNNTLLRGFRALDLTDEKGLLCGRILADLGVDVIKIEKPGGDPSRNIGPFYHNIPHPEKSLYWIGYNVNKRGITLDIDTIDGRDIFRKLVRRADFIIESFPPGYMDNLGLGYSALSEINPRIIVTSITPFGQEGPYSDYKASDMVVLALGGQMYLCGDPDRPPVQIGFPQSFLHAGVQGAMGTMIAHYYREGTGEGQHVDVSAQESVYLTLLNAPLYWEFYRRNLKREGQYRTGLSVLGAVQRQIWPCKDGYIIYAIYGGGVGVFSNGALVQWMDEEGMAPDFLKAFEWDKFDMAAVTQEQFDLLEQPMGRFFETHTKAELLEGAVKRRIMLYPVATVEDIMQSPQLKARSFWTKLERPELDATLIYPGSFVKISQALCNVRHPAPLIGEHNIDIYESELGLERDNIVALKQRQVI